MTSEVAYFRESVAQMLMTPWVETNEYQNFSYEIATLEVESLKDEIREITKLLQQLRNYLFYRQQLLIQRSLK